MGFGGKFRACSRVLSSQLCFRHIVDAQEMDEKELKKRWEFGNRRRRFWIQKEVLDTQSLRNWSLPLGSAISPRKRAWFGSWYKTDNLQVP